MDENVLDDEARLKIESDRVKAAEKVRDQIAEKDNTDFDDDGRLDLDAGLEAEAERLATAQEHQELLAERDALVEGETNGEDFGLVDPEPEEKPKPAKKTAAKRPAKKAAPKKTTKKAPAKKTAAKG